MGNAFHVKSGLILLVMVGGVLVSGRIRAQDANAAQQVPPPFTLSIVPVAPTVKSGSDVFVDVTMENKSDHDLRVTIGDDKAGREYHIDVWDEQGATPPETKFSRMLHHRLTPEEEATGPQALTFTLLFDALAPGKSITNRVRVSKMYDLGKPGKYSVQVVRFGEDSKTLVKSNKITVTVTP